MTNLRRRIERLENSIGIDATSLSDDDVLYAMKSGLVWAPHLQHLYEVMAVHVRAALVMAAIVERDRPIPHYQHFFMMTTVAGAAMPSLSHIGDDWLEGSPLSEHLEEQTWPALWTRSLAIEYFRQVDDPADAARSWLCEGLVLAVLGSDHGASIKADVDRVYEAAALGDGDGVMPLHYSAPPPELQARLERLHGALNPRPILPVLVLPAKVAAFFDGSTT